ncbi:hypothetical protein [Pseudoruegeria sp. SK021]|nr:hypothetical protein [Pseudoruegeria sp. SK021]
MIRLVIYLVLFTTGLWAGAKYERAIYSDACHAAGGSVDPRHFCTGAP